MIALARKLLAVLCAAAAVLTVQPARCQESPSRYNQVMRLIGAFSGSPNVRMLPFGKTYSGLSIPAYVITDFSVKPEGKIRIFVCSGQHGNEFDAVRSVLSLSCRLISGTEPELLAKCAFIVAPMVNPHGITANTRLSAEGEDVNRDWVNPSSPEARHISELIKAWRPHLLVDAHEWTEPIQANGNQIEAPYCLSASRQRRLDALAKRISAQTGLSLVHTGIYSDKRLFHRSYAYMGYAAYLLETKGSEDYATKNKLYSSAILSLARAVSGDAASGLALSPTSAKFNMSAVRPYLKPLSTDDPAALASAFYRSALLVVGYGLCLWIIRPFARERKTKWSRRYVRCDVEESIQISPLMMRHAPASITTRSWVNRHLRTRYSTPPPDPITPDQDPEPPLDAIPTFRTPRYATAPRIGVGDRA